MKNICLFLIVAIGMLGACKKKNALERVVSGRVFDANTGQSIANADVQLKANVLKNGIYNVNSSTLATVKTGSDGTYSFTFDKVNAEKYTIHVEGSTSFVASKDITPDEMYAANPYKIDIPAYLKSTVKVHIKNGAVLPNPTDQINYGYKGAVMPCDCCTRDAIVLYGNVDTTFSCDVYANQYFIYNYSVDRQNSMLVYVKDSVMSSAGDTARINIIY